MSCKQAVSLIFSVVTLFASGSALAADDPCGCPKIYEPVCAVNHQVYGNECEADCAGTEVVEESGALIEFYDRRGDLYTFWSTNDAFIDEALAVIDGDAEQRVPFFLELEWNNMCTRGYNFMPNSDAMEWRDKPKRKCNAPLRKVDADKHKWVDIIGMWCPGGTELVGVWDYRNQSGS